MKTYRPPPEFGTTLIPQGLRVADKTIMKKRCREEATDVAAADEGKEEKTVPKIEKRITPVVRDGWTVWPKPQPIKPKRPPAVIMNSV